MGLGDKAIHQGRLADTGVAQQHGDATVQQFMHRLQRLVAARGHHDQIQIGELLGECGRVGQVGLCQAQDRGEAAGVGGDQRAVHQTGARRRVGECDHGHHLVGVGDHHPFGGIGVIGGAAQHRPAFAAPHDSGQGVRPARQVADHVDLVADHDRCTAEFTGPHGGHQPIRIPAEHDAPAAAVDRHHHARLGVGVLGANLGARTRAPTGTDLDVGLVVLACAQADPSMSDPSMSDHNRGNSGSVLAVVPMSSTVTPLTRRPTIAPAIAIR